MTRIDKNSAILAENRVVSYLKARAEAGFIKTMTVKKDGKKATGLTGYKQTTNTLSRMAVKGMLVKVGFGKYTLGTTPPREIGVAKVAPNIGDEKPNELENKATELEAKANELAEKIVKETFKKAMNKPEINSDLLATLEYANHINAPLYIAMALTAINQKEYEYAILFIQQHLNKR
jgi:hypothetical protein